MIPDIAIKVVPNTSHMNCRSTKNTIPGTNNPMLKFEVKKFFIGLNLVLDILGFVKRLQAGYPVK